MNNSTRALEHKAANWNPLFDSNEFTDAEKDYIFGFQYHHCGSFMKLLYETIHQADEGNLVRLRMGFPGEVDAVLAWTRGDLAERFRKIVDFAD